MRQRGQQTADEVSASGPPRAAPSAPSPPLRAGRSRRKAHLERVDLRATIRARPLDRDARRDRGAAARHGRRRFDLVILDEASMIDQPSASAASCGRSGR
ncbi:MAG: hypothetical protein R2711_07440 [Acidimicrobiales bacterium]